MLWNCSPLSIILYASFGGLAVSFKQVTFLLDSFEGLDKIPPKQKTDTGSNHMVIDHGYLARKETPKITTQSEHY